MVDLNCVEDDSFRWEIIIHPRLLLHFHASDHLEHCFG
jgi:hypothetical protein